MGDESESVDEPSRNPDGSDEPTDLSTESADTSPASDPADEETSGDATGTPADDVDSENGSDVTEDAEAEDVDAEPADGDDTESAIEEFESTADRAVTGRSDGGESADGGVVNEMPDGFEDDFSDFDDDSDLDAGLVDGPESDQEMPLADHIEEMVRRLAVVFILGGGVALAVFGLGETVDYIPSTIDIIDFLWDAHITDNVDLARLDLERSDLRPRVYGPLELLLTKLKVAGLVGVVVGLPVFVYESYLFMRPGLYKNERKYYLASIPTSLVLALVGVAFAHLVVLPVIFAYFTSYTQGTAVIAFGLAETFNLILILMGYMAIVFQIPLFIMLAIMMNLVTRQWLENKRLIFWGAFLGLAFLVSPDPTGMAPIIIAITMVTLFEGTLALLRWTGN